MQIFGRAGRPQYDNKGEGIIITAHDRLSHYLTLLTRQHQIESKFEARIADNLNAEVSFIQKQGYELKFYKKFRSMSSYIILKFKYLYIIYFVQLYNNIPCSLDQTKMNF